MITFMLVIATTCAATAGYASVKRWNDLRRGCPTCHGRLDRRAFRLHCAGCGAIWVFDRDGLVPAAEFRGDSDEPPPPPRATARFRRP